MSLFLTLAKTQLGSIMTQAAGKIVELKTAIQGMIDPLREQLSKYEAMLREIEKSRNEAYGSLSNQITSLTKSQEEL